MPKTVKLTPPLTNEDVRNLEVGDKVLVSGVIYTARDAAHKRLLDLLEAGKPLPMELQGQILYYVGPSPARPGRVIGAAGPTTSYRMDSYAPTLLRLGLKAMIGKGKRSPEVIAAMREKWRKFREYNFGTLKDDALITFYDLAQEYETMENFYRVSVWIIKEFFDLDCRLYLICVDGRLELVCDSLRGVY